MFEPPIWVAGPEAPYAYDVEGCQHDSGITYVLLDAAGNQVGSCVTVDGICSAEVPENTVVDVQPLNAPEGTSRQDSSTVGTAFAIIFNSPPGQGVTNEPEPIAGELPETGQLAYAIRGDDGHWSVWTHDFSTGENIQLSNEPDCDQFAPAYSHDGTRIAYLSDQVELINQVWVMDANGGNQRQVTTYTGPGTLIHVAWTFDDESLVVTEVDPNRSASMLSTPSDGGPLTPYWDEMGGWPTFAKDKMAFILEGDLGAPWVAMYWHGERRADVVEPSLFGDPFLFGNPNLAPAGRYLTLDIGERGARRVIAFVPYSDIPIPAIPVVGTDNGNPVLSPDEARVAFVAITGETQAIMVYPLDNSTGAAEVELPDHNRVWYLSWRPESE